ncbi:uncharacterized protein A4U43_C08F18210 [Asparagus officinalis]|nr:uncharacterized protein A4U43_C08F18210 [Asparagus officinalis]
MRGSIGVEGGSSGSLGCLAWAENERSMRGGDEGNERALGCGGEERGGAAVVVKGMTVWLTSVGARAGAARWVKIVEKYRSGSLGKVEVSLAYKDIEMREGRIMLDVGVRDEGDESKDDQGETVPTTIQPTPTPKSSTALPCLSHDLSQAL